MRYYPCPEAEKKPPCDPPAPSCLTSLENQQSCSRQQRAYWVEGDSPGQTPILYESIRAMERCVVGGAVRPPPNTPPTLGPLL